MMFTTVTLIATWFIAIQIRDGNNFGFFNYNLKGSIAYASFVSLILAFVVAIIACAYNYFLDNFDDEEEEDDEDEDEDDEEEEEIKPQKVRKVTSEEVKEKARETVAVDIAKKPTTRTVSKPRTTAAKKTTTSKTTTKSSTAKKTASK